MQDVRYVSKEMWKFLYYEYGDCLQKDGTIKILGIVHKEKE